MLCFCTTLSRRLPLATSPISTMPASLTSHGKPHRFYYTPIPIVPILFLTFVLLCRSNDGHILAVTSSDGYCSLVTFHPGELGSPLEQDKLPSVITQHQCKQPVEAAPGAKSPPPAQSGAKDRERAVSKDSAIKPRRIRPTTITSIGSPEEKQGSKSPSPSSSSTQKQLTSSQDAHVGSTASTTKSPCVEGGIPSTKSPSAEVPQKKPSGPRRVNFVTLSSPAPKHSDSEPMEVQIIE